MTCAAPKQLMFESDSVSSGPWFLPLPDEFDAADVRTWSLRCALSSAYEVLTPALSRVELEMLVISGAIRAKRDWFDKFKEREVRGRWRRELVACGWAKGLVNFVFAELECYFLPQVDRATGVTPDAVDGVFRSDALLSCAEAADLKAALLALESTTPVHMRDWHPGSGDLVLDVVHPSLFCAVTNETLLATSAAVRERRSRHFLTPHYRVGRAGVPTASGDKPAEQPQKRARVADDDELVQAPAWLAGWFDGERIAADNVPPSLAAAIVSIQDGVATVRPRLLICVLADCVRQDPDDARAVYSGELVLSLHSGLEITDELRRLRVRLAQSLLRLGEKQKAWAMLAPVAEVLTLSELDSVRGLAGDEPRAVHFQLADRELGRFVPDDALHWRRTIGGHGSTTFDAEQPLHGHNAWRDSKTFQWLPSEVDVDERGVARFVSYINNLHPNRHGALYGTLERLFGRFVPLFERVLGDLAGPEHRRIPYVGLAPLHGLPHRERFDAEMSIRETERDGDGEIVRAMADVDADLRNMARPFDGLTAPPPAATAAKLPLPRAVSLKNRRLQVIVKVAGIHLTPEQPDYDGGSWHLEGCTNERIVATGIFYFDSHNITTSKLAFRAAIAEPSCAQHELDSHANFYGVGNCTELVQPRGAVE